MNAISRHLVAILLVSLVGAAVRPTVLPAAPPTPATPTTPPAAPPPPPAPTVTFQTAPAAAGIAGTRAHSATGAAVVVSSTHEEWPGEESAGALVDGDLGTRWSSDYAAPQQVTMDLGSIKSLRLIRLHWEDAFAAQYTVSISRDGKAWTKLYTCKRPANDIEMPVDTLTCKHLTTRWVRFDLEKRINAEWGFSLYEIELQ